MVVEMMPPQMQPRLSARGPAWAGAMGPRRARGNEPGAVLHNQMIAADGAAEAADGKPDAEHAAAA